MIVDDRQLGAILLAVLFFLGAPLLLGILILAKKHKNALLWYAGLLTLKPVVATPIWYAVSYNRSSSSWLTLALPGVGLTVILTLLCRTAFFNIATSGMARKLLMLDTLRWGSSWLWAMLLRESSSDTSVTFLFCSLGLLALAMPTIFAAVATIVVGKYEGVLDGADGQHAG